MKRDYNFRQAAKEKEQEKRRIIWNTGYFPSMPKKGYGDHGEEYFTEGQSQPYKKHLKKQANKAVRRAPLGSIGSGKNYKRVYELIWAWY